MEFCALKLIITHTVKLFADRLYYVQIETLKCAPSLSNANTYTLSAQVKRKQL